MSQADQFLQWIYETKQWTLDQAAKEMGVPEWVLQRIAVEISVTKQHVAKIRAAGYMGPIKEKNHK